MGQSEIAAVRALLSSKPRPVGWAERRQRLDEVGTVWPVASDIRLSTVEFGGIPAEWSLAPGSDPSRVLLYFHGGGYCSGSIASHRRLVTEAGRAAGRIPIRASATIRMMSPARRSPLTQARVDIASGRRSPLVVAPPPADPGGVSDRWNEAAGMIDFTSPPAEASGPASGDLVLPLDNGFLAIGSDRPYPQPATHPALCDG